jgi:tryptophan-rich sensory protein
MSSKWRNVLALLIAIAVPFLAAGLGGAATASSVTTWYPSLRKPAWNPPTWLFGPVWTLLYLLMGVASWQVWRLGQSDRRVRTALGFYGAQLVFNVLWSVLFFGLRRMGWALAEIVVLWALILQTLVRFYRLRPAAGLLLVPYQLWVSFATVLNAALWWLNR